MGATAPKKPSERSPSGSAKPPAPTRPEQHWSLPYNADPLHRLSDDRLAADLSVLRAEQHRRAQDRLREARADRYEHCRTVAELATALTHLVRDHDSRDCSDDKIISPPESCARCLLLSLSAGKHAYGVMDDDYHLEIRVVHDPLPEPEESPL